MIDSNISKNDLFRVTQQDILFIILLVCIGIWFIFDAVYIDPVMHPGFDLHSYIKLAENPLSFLDSSIPGVHAQRIFGTALVWMINFLFGVSIETGFRIISGTSYLMFILLFYSILRSWEVNSIVAYSTTALTAIASWPMTYSLANIYQVCDALSYPLTLLIIFLAIRGKDDALFPVSIIAVLTRQNMLILVLLAHLFLYLKNVKKIRNIIYISVLLILFMVTLLFAGDRQGFALLNGITTGSFFKFKHMLIAASDLRVWTLFSPFLLVYFNTRAIDYIKEYWWVYIYSLYTILQGFGLYESMGYWDNISRWMMQGIMPLFLFAGLLLNEIFNDKKILTIYGLLPFAYGINHLSFLKYTYPSLLGHRTVSVFVIFLLIVLSWKISKKDGSTKLK